MTDELPVQISREELHALEVPAAIEVAGSFDVRLVNHGQSCHVHLHLDDSLSEVAAIEAGNHFVEGNSERRVRVDIDTERIGESFLGKLKVASAHGANTRWIDVEITEPEPVTKSVEVDESLAKPRPKPTEPPLIERPEVIALAVSAVGLGIAMIAGLAVGNVFVIVGSLVGLGGVLLALSVLVSS